MSAAAETAAQAAQAAQAAPAAAQGIPLSLPLVAIIMLTLLFLVGLIRALPWTDAMRAKKPLSCNACMTFWVGLVLFLILSATAGWPAALLHVLPAAGAALILLTWQDAKVGPSAGPPPPL